MTDAGVPARRAALRLLDAVLRRGLPLESALASATADLERADDRGLAHAIAATVLRRLPDLDTLIDSATAKRLPHDSKARMALRIALAQALGLGTPGHAAIATVLPLMDGGPRRLVHGVFGSLMRGGADWPASPLLPEPVAKRWRRAWGDDVVAAAGRSIAAPPPIDVGLVEEGAALPDATPLAPGHWRLPPGARVADLPEQLGGRWWVQDIAASLPARLLGAGAGRRAIDLCAAPGGKTLQLAANGWAVIALDLSESRLARLADNLARTGLSAEVIAADAGVWTPPAPVEAVLLDAPCSATGIFRRHPDVLHRVRPKAVAELADAQARLLAHAAAMVAPGGALIYAVCSLEPEEGEAVARAFSHGDFRIDPVSNHELPEGFAPDSDGFVRVLPGTLADKGGADGFFVARFRRA